MANEQCITRWLIKKKKKSQKCDFTPDADANIPIQTELEYLTLARQTRCTNKHIHGAFTLHPTQKH